MSVSLEALKMQGLNMAKNKKETTRTYPDDPINYLHFPFRNDC